LPIAKKPLNSRFNARRHWRTWGLPEEKDYSWLQ
jgi:hypothetical protein